MGSDPMVNPDKSKGKTMNMKRMMMIAALTAILGGTGFVPSAEAAVTVTNVICQQHYPWNGLVDIDYEITSDQPDAKYWVYPKGTDNRLGKRVIMNTLSGDGATNYVGVGKHRMVWDAKADMPRFHTPDLQVTLQVIADGAKYLVIDISGGTNAVTYPVRYSTEEPVISDVCKTDEIWLHLILPGTFVMGSPVTEYEHKSQSEEQHQVTLTKPYYIGIFEITQKQWEHVMGTNPAECKGESRPIENIAYGDIRGFSLGAQWPTTNAVDTGSFMGVLRNKTMLVWDLPTEAQWEYACRAGTVSSANTGREITWYIHDSAMDEVGRYRSNNGSNKGGYVGGSAAVGNFKVNAWGLYDMHGNVWEWCRDYYNEYVGSIPVTDPAGWTNGGRSARGGGWDSDAGDCRSARRVSGNKNSQTGFRAVVLPFE